MFKWIRTCQECGYKQEGNKPNKNEPLRTNYTEMPCKRCKSPGLDFGKEVDTAQYNPESK